MTNENAFVDLPLFCEIKIRQIVRQLDTGIKVIKNLTKKIVYNVVYINTFISTWTKAVLEKHTFTHVLLGLRQYYIIF